MGSSENTVFDHLTDEHLGKFAAKADALPTREEFEREVEEALAATLDPNGEGLPVAYDELENEHGKLIGYGDSAESELPWWLSDFDWQVSSQSVDELTLSVNNLIQFDDFLASSTTVDNVSVDSLTIGTALEAFSRLVERIRNIDSVDATDHVADVDGDEYTLPSKFFVVPENGRIETASEFETWFESLVDLCPPCDATATALLRVNTGVKRHQASRVLDAHDRDRLDKIGVFDSRDEEERATDEQIVDPLHTVLDLRAPFDLAFRSGHEELTPLRYHYHVAWAETVDRTLPDEPEFLRKAHSRDTLDEATEGRFAEIAFQTPLRIGTSRGRIEFETGTSRAYRTNRDAITQVLSEYGHSPNDD